MSYTVTQKATTPNAAYTRLIYTVSGSTKASQPQFSYLVDIYESGSTNRLQRIIQGVNPAGVSVFDPSRLFQGELSEDQSWKISSVTPYVSSSKTFTLEFGEQYGTSDSSSLAVSSSIRTENIEVIRNAVEPNSGFYNWQSSSYAVLSNMPSTMSMQVDDYGTISVYNNDVSYVSQSFYSASNTESTSSGCDLIYGYQLIEEKNYDITSSFSSIPITSSTPYWNYAEINVSSSIGLQSYKYEVSDETHREKTRFAFINKLGTWDYYNNYNPVRQEISVLREQYTAARVDYSSITSDYNISRKGLTTYHSNTDDSFAVDTDFLDKTNANWLEELIESPSVYIQRNGEFIPIVINDSSYTANTNQARQKLFKYTITFTPSNQPFGKWEPEYVTCPPLQGNAPLVVTGDITDIKSSSIDISGYVVSDGGVEVTERGFVYAPFTTTPTINDTKLTTGAGVGEFSTTLSSLTSGSNLSIRAYASNSLDVSYGEVKTATLPGTLILSDFSPYAGGISTSSLLYWYDFTNSGSMTISSSLEGEQILSVASKGIYSSSIERNATGLQRIAPLLHSDGYADFDPYINDQDHAKLTTKYGSYQASLPGFETGSNYTSITFTKTPFLTSNQKDIIDYTDPDNSSNHFRGYTFVSTRNGDGIAPDFTGSFNSATETYISASGVSINASGEFGSNAYGIFYSYECTRAPWESRFTKFTPAPGTSGSIAGGRKPGENIQSLGPFQVGVAGSTGLGLTFGGNADGGGGDNTPLKVAHFLHYDVHLTDDQISAVINSFTGSVSYGSELNSIDN